MRNETDDDAASPSPVRTAHALTPWLAAAALLGALLLFLVQPLIGKAILPWFGGAASVWTVCMLFFQTALIAGYGGVYALANVQRAERRTYAYLAALAAAMFFLPILPSAAWKPTSADFPAWRVLTLLALTIGVPYAVLAMTAPLVQTWFVRVHGGRAPYRLYALSNVGSLLALIAYPLLVEPNLDVATQARWWSYAFGAFGLLMAWCAWQVRSWPDPPAVNLPAAKTKQGKKEVAAGVSPRRQVAEWLGLSGAGSVLLLVVTAYLCQDVTSVPFLWVAPLAVYLITYILCFDRPQWYVPTLYAAAVGLLVPWILTTIGPTFEVAAVQQLGLLFAGCMICHGELARRRPPPHDLARYYLLIACGGALGGAAVSLLAPTVFHRDWERPLAYAGLITFAVVTGFGILRRVARLGPRLQKTLTAVTVVGTCASIFLAYHARIRSREVEVARNFYGIVSVHGPEDDERPGHYRYLAMMSGSTLHGSEVFIAGERGVPESYYGPTSGVGRVMQLWYADPQPRRVGVVGLGVGTLASYGRKSDEFRFYELNPVVEDFARRRFTYLGESYANCAVILGDGRLSLEAEPSQQFDLLVLDAFTSDSIPTHMLTLEAFALWLRHLRDDGRIAVHISNRHLNLAAVLAAAAEHHGLSGVVIDSPGEAIAASQAANWVVLSRTAAGIAFPTIPKSTVTPLNDYRTGIRPWTDSFSSFLGILR
jgi:hypothetical protein